MAKKKQAESKEISEVAESEKAAPAASNDVVHLTYNIDNNHILDGVHAIAKGLNTLPKAVWEKHKKHPAIVHMISNGHLVDHSAKKSAEKEPELDESGAEGEEKSAE